MAESERASAVGTFIPATLVSENALRLLRGGGLRYEEDLGMAGKCEKYELFN